MTEMTPLQDPFSRTEPRALINIVPRAFADALLKSYEEKPEWFGVAERDLWKTLRSENMLPNQSDNQLRMKFWMEYDMAQAEGRNVNMKAVVAGVCSEQYLHQAYLRSPAKMAWLMTPPANYLITVEEALDAGLKQLRSILDVDPVGPSGKVDTKLAEIQLKVVAMLDARVKGAVVQKTMNLHANVPAKKLTEITETRSMEELDRRLKDIERRRRKAQNQIVDSAAVSAEQASSGDQTSGP